MINRETRMISDAELDTLLAAASKPVLVPGFEARLAQRMAPASMMGTNVIAFPIMARKSVAPPATLALRLHFTAAMAASLLIGLWLGGNGPLVNVLDQLSPDGAVLEANNDIAATLLEDLATVDMDNLS